MFRQEMTASSPDTVASGPGSQRSAVVTPDDRWILYWSDQDLMRQPVAGGPTDKVATLPGADQFHCPSRGSSCVLGEMDVARMQYVFFALDPLAGKGRELARIAARPPFTNWDVSPDGTRAAVVDFRSGRIRLVSLDDGKETEVPIQGAWSFEFIAWRPDGKGWYVNGYTPSSYYPGLYAVELNGRARALRDEPNAWFVLPKPSRDGRHLAYARMPFHGNVWMIEGF